MKANERISVSGYKVFYKSVSIVILFQLSASEKIQFRFLDWEEVVILKLCLSANLGVESEEEGKI